MDFEPQVWFSDCSAKSRARVLNTGFCHAHAIEVARDLLVGAKEQSAHGIALVSSTAFSKLLTSEIDGNDGAIRPEDFTIWRIG